MILATPGPMCSTGDEWHAMLAMENACKASCWVRQPCILSMWGRHKEASYLSTDSEQRRLLMPFSRVFSPRRSFTCSHS